MSGKSLNNNSSPARNAIILTGVVLLLLGGLLIIRQGIIASKQAPAVSLVDKTALYSYPNNYRQPIGHYYTYYLDSLNLLNIKYVDSLQDAGKFIAWRNPGMPINLGMQNRYMWFYLPVKNESPHDVCLVWQLFNTIDTAQLFCKTDSAEQISLCSQPRPSNSRSGRTATLQQREIYRAPKTESHIYSHSFISYYTPLSERSLPLRAAFDTVWLKPGERKELYMHVWKSDYNTYLPFTVLPLSELLEQENFSSNIYCVYMAIFAFIILFNFFLYYSLRDIIHLWYPFFIFNISMGLLIEGYYQVFLFPEWLHRILCTTMNTPFADFSLVGTGRVMQLLLQQKRSNSRFWLGVTILLSLGLLWGVVQLLYGAWCVKSGFTYPYFVFRGVSDMLLWGTTLLLVCSVIEKVIQRQPLARIYLFTSLLPTLGLLNSYLNSVGITDFFIIYPNGFAVGVMLEILMLTMLLTQRYNMLQKEKNYLLQQQLVLQKEMSDRVAETLESEQRRIAADLHDGLGSYMTALRLMVNKSMHYFASKGQAEPAKTLEAVQQQIDRAVGDIRTISHNLMPNDFERYTFSEIIKNHLTAILSTTELQIEYYIDEHINNISKGTQLTLYRIFTEVISNALKHANCGHITTQFIVYENTLQMQVEDDGQGFKNEAGDSGIGLKNIQSRVDFLKGKLNIDSSEKGTMLIIEIPLS